MSFFDFLRRKKHPPCPPAQENKELIEQTLIDTNTRVGLLEKLLENNGLDKLMIAKKEKEKSNGLDSVSIRRSCGC